MLPSESRLETRAVHSGMEGLRESGLHVPSIDLSTTNPLPSVELGGESYEQLAGGGDLLPGQSAVYQRLWQPGVARFEDGLAALEGAEGAVAYATGMAALTACLLASVTAGKPHIVALRPLYGGTDHVLDSGLLGTTVTWTDIDHVAAVHPRRHGTRGHRVPREPDSRTDGHRARGAGGRNGSGAGGQHLRHPGPAAADRARRHTGPAQRHQIPRRPRGRHGRGRGRQQGLGAAAPPRARTDRRPAASVRRIPAAPRTAHPAGAGARPAGDRRRTRPSDPGPSGAVPGAVPVAARMRPGRAAGHPDGGPRAR